MPDPEPPHQTRTPSCASALASLIAGELEELRGLPGCKRSDVEAVWGPGQPGPGLLGPCSRYDVRSRGAEGAKPTVEVTYSDDRAFALIFRPAWTADALTLLGPPDHDGPSGFGPEYHQQTWSSRGLIAHAARGDSSLWLVVAFAPVPLETLLTSTLFHLGVVEHPDRPSRR